MFGSVILHECTLSTPTQKLSEFTSRRLLTIPIKLGGLLHDAHSKQLSIIPPRRLLQFHLCHFPTVRSLETCEKMANRRISPHRAGQVGTDTITCTRFAQ